MKYLKQYKNLSKEIYVLFFGRIVTSMGSLIWPIMTLILKNKLGYSATTIATIDMVLAIFQFPIVILGGKLADSVSRKKTVVSRLPDSEKKWAMSGQTLTTSIAIVVS